MITESVDLCVIGSGAGGAVIGHAAAAAGRSTLILERGPWVRSQEMSHIELDMIARIYKDGGLQTNASMDMALMQGTCVGGSTVLANNVMFRAPDEALARWERLGARFDRARLAQSYATIEKTLGIAAPRPETISSGTHLFMKGAKVLGLAPQWMQKALRGCTGCGGCNIGCVFDHKPSMMNTFIPWAVEKGARVLAETSVENIEWRSSRAVALRAHTGRDRTPLRVVAKQIVVAGGAIGSSALLLKSGITRNVGTRVSFNAGSMGIVEFGEPIDAFEGDQMTAYLHGDGFLIEPTHYPPLTAALLTPGWFRDHGDIMRDFRRYTFGGVLVGTQAVGRVTYSRLFGHEETHFQPPPADLDRLKRGLKIVARTYFAAGAKRVILPTHTFRTLTSPDEVDQIDGAFHSIREIVYGSSHPQGGNPWSDDPELGAVDSNFAVHGFENLYVCDASLFPDCIGVNPLDTILALADYAAPKILARG